MSYSFEQLKAAIMEQVNWLSNKLDERLPENMDEVAIQDIALASLAFKRLGDHKNHEQLEIYARQIAEGMKPIEKKVELVT